jgi:ribonuclease HI
LWQLTKTLNGDNRQPRTTVIQAGENHITGKAAANVLAKTYEAISTVPVSKERTQEVRQEIHTVLTQTPGETNVCMTENFTIQELEAALKKLKKKKSPGADGITNEMLQNLGERAKRILLDIFNQSWHTGQFPTTWKEAHIVPILKKGKDKSKPDSFRPISLLSCVGKLLERMVNRRLLYHLESNGLLAPTQTGYRQHRSTEDQLAYLTQDIEDAFQEKKKTLAVFFDLSKAFDRVWKEGLKLKLLRNGIQGKMYRWLCDFLHNRRARVKLDGKLSNLVKLREGVPQGGVISPTLFVVYINDITSALPRRVLNTLHADDLAVWCTETSTATATHRIQESVNKVAEWTDKWALKINTQKTAVTLFTLSTAKEKVTLRLNNEIIPQTDTPTFLGTTLDSRLTWKPHIEGIHEKAHKKLNLMKKMAGTTWGANPKILHQLYTGTVRPVTEYASTSWVTASKTNKSKLDKVQNTGLRIILGAMKTTPITEMEKTADLEPLETRREYKALVQSEKARRLPSHPLHTKLQNRTKNRLKRKSLNHIVKDLHKQKPDILAPTVEPLQPDTWTPRHHVPNIRLEVPGVEGKGNQPPALQKALTLELIHNRYPDHTWIHAYTDGSAENAVRNAGGGVYIKYPDKTLYTLSIPVGEKSSNYRAEVQALDAATEHLIQQGIQRASIVFLTDSLSALQALQTGPTDSALQHLQSSLDSLSACCNVVLQWVPAHVGLAGNEAADRLAKEGTKKAQPQPPVRFKEAQSAIKSSYREIQKARNGEYSPKGDEMKLLDRNGQTIIFRLRTGHCRLRRHMKKVGLTDTATCECGAEEQTPLHILQCCPNLEELRDNTWATSTPYHQKLWGDVKDLQKTVDFITTTQLRI